MTVLAANVAHETDLGVVEVENRLAPGRYRFRLTVFDEARNESEPAFITVTVSEVQRETRPDPRVEPRIDPRVILDRGAVFDRGAVLNPDLGRLRPVFPRRPGG